MISLTVEQAEVIAGVLATADNYCETCAGDLADKMAVACPGHDWAGLVAAAHEAYWDDEDDSATDGAHA